MIIMTNSYDKIYVINLDKSEARWTKVSKTLKQNDMEFTRFAGVDGGNVLIKNLSKDTEFRGAAFKNEPNENREDIYSKLT